MRHRLRALASDPVQRLRHRTFTRCKQGRDGGGLERALLQLPQVLKFLVKKERRLEADHASMFRGLHQHRVPRSQVKIQRNDKRFAQRVDGRIGNLCEHLPEIVVKRSGTAGKRRQWGIVAHRAYRFSFLATQRLDQQLDIFFGVACGALRGHERRTIERCQAPARPVRAIGITAAVTVTVVFLGPRQRHKVGLEPRREDHVSRNPFAVLAPVRHLALYLLVLEDLLVLEIHQENLTGTQTPFFLDALGFNGQDANFRAQHHQAIMGHRVARRPQAVAIERRSYQMPVEKSHRCRAVPRLHQARMVVIEGLHVRRDLDRAFPGFGDHHEQRVLHGASGAREQLESIVKTRRVAAAGLDHRLQPFHVFAPIRVLQHGFPRPHPVAIPQQRIDLAVVSHQPERLSQIPAR